jgi:hypothetical protein
MKSRRKIHMGAVSASRDAVGAKAPGAGTAAATRCLEDGGGGPTTPDKP